MPFRRRREGDGEAGEDLAFVVDLWRRLAARDEAVWDDLAALDRFAGGGSAEQRTAFGIDVLEMLQNLLSHPDSGVYPAAVRRRLGPALGLLWDELDAHWARVANWVDATGVPPTRVPPEAVYAVSDSLLANMARAMHRTLPDGRFVSLADAARRQQATGESFAAT